MLPLLIASLASQAIAQTPSIPGNFTLTFNEDFNGTSLDATKWKVGKHLVGMSDKYSACDPNNVTVSSGTLKLKVNSTPMTQWGVYREVRGAEISTFGLFQQQYGYFEARLKYPSIKGLWPAFWTMPNRQLYGNQNYYRQGYLKFDLTNSGITTVNTAILRLKIKSVAAADNHFLVMKLANDTWTESTLTWNTRPLPNPAWLQSYWDSVAGQVIDTDVKTVLQTQFGGGDKKISFVLKDSFMRARNIVIYSSEDATAANRPQLIVNGQAFTATEDTYVSWGNNANTTYGDSNEIWVRDDYDTNDTASTLNGGMEFDICEALGIWGNTKVNCACHWNGYTDPMHQVTGSTAILSSTTTDQFVTYGWYWKPGLLEWYINGYKKWTWGPNAPEVGSVAGFLILSMQVGGWPDSGNKLTDPPTQAERDAINNQVMEVDWVRAWSGTRY